MLAEIGTVAMLTLAGADLTFDYELHPFGVGNHANERAFEAFLDALGERGYLAQIAWASDPFDPSDDERFFVRRTGGESMRSEYAVGRLPFATNEGVESWVPAYDELGKNGELVIHTWSSGGETRMVTARYFLGARLVMHRFDSERIGPAPVTGTADLKRSSKALAKRGYTFVAPAIDTGFRNLWAVGIARTRSNRLPRVKLRFRSVRRLWEGAKLATEASKQGRKGFRLATVVPDARGWLYVFAREIGEDGKIRRDCVAHSYARHEPAEGLLALLNQRGAQGFEFAGFWPVDQGQTPVLLLCDPS